MLQMSFQIHLEGLEPHSPLDPPMLSERFCFEILRAQYVLKNGTKTYWKKEKDE
jgi:hypothetical protein